MLKKAWNTVFPVLSVLFTGQSAFAQLPVCTGGGAGGIYIYTNNRNIYNWDPAQPFSGTNPVTNLITTPPGANGLAVSSNLNAPGPSPTFYTWLNELYYYYDGTNWVSTGHAIPSGAANPAGGGGFIYNLMGYNGQVWKYDGTGDATLLMTVPDFLVGPLRGGGPYDLAADRQGNFYILKTTIPDQWLRQYNPDGVLLRQWSLTGAPSDTGGAALAILCDELYYHSGSSAKHGIIGDTSVSVSLIPTTSPFTGLNNFGSCEAVISDISGGNDTVVHIVRGCASAFINFHRHIAGELPYRFKLVITGTAVNGTDYRYIDTILEIPANQKDTTLEIQPLLVSNPSGTKEVIIQVWGISCAAGGQEGILREIKAYIHDSLGAAIVTPVDTFCSGTEITIEAQTDPGLDFEWQPQDQIPDPSQLIIRPKPAVTTTYTLTVTQPGAPLTCPSRTVSYTAPVEPYPEITIPDSIVACPEDSLDIIVSVAPETGNYRYQWSPPDYLRNDHDPANKFFAPPGAYKKVITVSTAGANCTSRDSIIITVVPPFKIERVSPADTTINYGDVIQLHAEGEAVRWRWTPSAYLDAADIPHPLAAPLESMLYTVTGIDAYGCRDTAQVSIQVDYSARIWIPSAFSPNGDGKNDVFRIANARYERLQEFRIYNRYGQKVFEAHDISQGWDGMFNGQPADGGVYFYNIRVMLPDGTSEVFKGDVTLVR